MQIQEVEKLARELLDQYLPGWGFTFFEGGITLGQCLPEKKLIMLSLPHIAHYGEDALRQVLLHEIAHGLVPKHGHSQVWKDKCKELGIDPEAPHPERLPGRWQATCRECGKAHTRYRRPAKVYRCDCSGGYNPRCYLDYKDMKGKTQYFEPSRKFIPRMYAIKYGGKNLGAEFRLFLGRVTWLEVERQLINLGLFTPQPYEHCQLDVLSTERFMIIRGGKVWLEASLVQGSSKEASRL